MERVLLIAGGGLPAELEFSALLAALEVSGPPVEAAVKDLEVFSGANPPPGYDLGTEIDGVLRAADTRGWDTFHLVGYSGGGRVPAAVRVLAGVPRLARRARG